MNSLPSGLPFNDAYRFLSYLKVKHQAGYFHKSHIATLPRTYGADKRTIAKLIQSLLNEGLLGQDENSYYLRSWSFVSGQKGYSTRAFKATPSEIKNKNLFEGKLFAAKVNSLQKLFRFRGRSRVRKNGDSHIKLTTPTGYLRQAFKISQGKVSKLKRIASTHGFITLTKNVEEVMPGTRYDAILLTQEIPGIYSSAGKLFKRKADSIESNVATFRIKNRKKYKPIKPNLLNEKPKEAKKQISFANRQEHAKGD